MWPEDGSFEQPKHVAGLDLLKHKSCVLMDYALIVYYTYITGMSHLQTQATGSSSAGLQIKGVVF
jgi:hypothetical protein